MASLTRRASWGGRGSRSAKRVGGIRAEAGGRTWRSRCAAVAERANGTDVAAVALLTDRALVPGGAFGAWGADGAGQAAGFHGLGVDDEADLLVEELLGLFEEVSDVGGLGLGGALEVVEDVDDSLGVYAVGVHQLDELEP